MLFVGERRSPTAIRRGWRWRNGRLAAKTLFDALVSVGIDPAKVQFTNLFERGGEQRVLAAARRGRRVIGMGKKVQRRLRELGISHTALIHPAARGRIRKKARYIQHVADVLR